VTAGQSYYIKVLGSGGPGSVGSYGLLVNFGNQPQSSIAPPNTVVASQPDQAGTGTVSTAAVSASAQTSSQTSIRPSVGLLGGLLGGVVNLLGGVLGLVWTTIGDLGGWSVEYTTGSSGGSASTAVVGTSNPAPNPGVPGTSGTTSFGLSALDAVLLYWPSKSPTTSSSSHGKGTPSVLS
jgi:hypothetical protein